MLSSDGRCFAFDQRANGFVPGEGVGVVVLKRLADAQRDGDAIYGVIEGWGVNQDGKTNGITAPNPQSQTRLEQGVYERYGIDPGAIQLIEAHGTGTKLGDPIEVEALKAAFGKYTQKRNYCALGSVKSNIGHCLTAAGVAGFIKLMLALKHRQQPPTIQFERVNEHIDVASSPFYVNRELKTWDVAPGETRRAAVSAFGFSGTNAHVVVSEYAQSEQKRNTTGPAAIVLSARTQEQLRQRVQDLAKHLESEQPALDDLAYTLQVGREAMEERLGLIAHSVDEVKAKLDAYLKGESVEDLYEGPIKPHKDTVALLSTDADLQQAISKWLTTGKEHKVLELWVKGLDVPWTAMYAERPRRISLPTYPFAKERYWADPADSDVAPPTTRKAIGLHPLLHENTSTLRQQTYTSRFDGAEFFLADHRVQIEERRIERVLPGMAYLEMALAASRFGAFMQDAPGAVELRDVVWLEPFVVTHARSLSIALLPRNASDDADEMLEFRIHSAHGAGERVHCLRARAAARLDLDALASRMGHARLDARKLYTALRDMGLHYGPAQQALTTADVGERQLLARLTLPQSIADTERQFTLHPSLLDAALQASVGLMLQEASLPTRPPVPFALDLVRVLAPCTREMVAWVRYASSATHGLWKFDIDLCDAQANVCVQLRGMSLRVLERETTAEPGPAVACIAADATESCADADADSLAFYERLVDAVAQHEISVDEAMDLS
jgi:acyl transferase domain-containing protein